MKNIAEAKLSSLKDKLLSQDTTQVEKVVAKIKKAIKPKK
jgi:hypothetical protein